MGQHEFKNTRKLYNRAQTLLAKLGECLSVLESTETSPYKVIRSGVKLYDNTRDVLEQTLRSFDTGDELLDDSDDEEVEMDSDEDEDSDGDEDEDDDDDDDEEVPRQRR